MVLVPRDYPERQLWALGSPKSETKRNKNIVETRKTQKTLPNEGHLKQKSERESQKDRKRAFRVDETLGFSMVANPPDPADPPETT